MATMAEINYKVRPEIVSYVETSIIPQYDGFDKGHRRDHVRQVIEQALELSSHYPVNPEISYIAAACHDLGLCEGRELHHMVSGRIMREDKALRQWFTEDEIETAAQAAEDHRASLGHEPRTIYGKIIAEADRIIIPEVVIRRTIQYGLSHYPEMDKEAQWMRMNDHLKEKYAEGGYLRLWIPESPNAARISELRALIADSARLRALFESIYSKETDNNRQ